MTADWPDDNPSAHRATAIYTKRVPVARNSTTLASATSKTLGASSVLALASNVAVDQPSFQLILNSQGVVGSATHPWSMANLIWFDSVTGISIATRAYINANGNGARNTLRILGPCRGDNVTIDLTNFDTVNTLTYDWSMSAISHDTVDDDVANDGIQTPAGFVPPGGNPDRGVVAVSAIPVAIGTPNALLMPVFNRRCKIVVDNTGQPNAVSVQVRDPDPAVPLYGSATGMQFFNSGSVAAGGVLVGEFQMPNGPALLKVTNLGSSGSITPVVSVTAFTNI